MTPEEFERLKEAEKAHLRKLKALKQAARQSRHQRSIGGALGNLASSSNLLDENDALVNQLNQDAVMGEARLDVALENMDAREDERQQAAQRAQFEADQKRQRADDLITQMKRQMGLIDDPAPTPASTAPDPIEKTVGKRQAPPATPASSPDPIPDKTIGRRRRS
ncbi:MAG: hypothetical protein RhofKO_17420 [Rhodothermales bacterium]